MKVAERIVENPIFQLHFLTQEACLPSPYNLLYEVILVGREEGHRFSLRSRTAPRASYFASPVTMFYTTPYYALRQSLKIERERERESTFRYMRVRFTHTYQDIISVENLLAAWEEFLKGKRKKVGVQEFSKHLMYRILSLHSDLVEKTYTHGNYTAFKITDPKPRDIHKAPVRDRLLHHAIYRQLYPFFDKTFITDSYSCRKNKGTHRAMSRFQEFAYKVSKNNTRTAWVLKCDIRKFFASIDQEVLMGILQEYIFDNQILLLVEQIVKSFSSTQKGKGLPLGNLTSQLLVNIYMNEFDQFVKHKLKVKYYVRYSDDFLFLSDDRKLIESLLPRIEEFLRDKLKLELHPKKVSIGTLSAGVDFLGWIHFFDHRILRSVTKWRMYNSLEREFSEASLASYNSMLEHGNTYKIQSKLHI